MHHSSIRDHLSKCHPEKSHNSCEPGYVFNSAAVPEPELSQAYEKNSMKNFDLIDSINQTKLFSLNHSSNQVKKPSKKLAKLKSFKNTLNSNVCSEIINNDKNNCSNLEINRSKHKILNKKDKSNNKMPKKITNFNSESGNMNYNHDDYEDDSFDYDVCNINYENTTNNKSDNGTSEDFKNENHHDIKYNISKTDEDLNKYENNTSKLHESFSTNLLKNLDLTVSLASTSGIQPMFSSNNLQKNEHQNEVIENYLNFSNLLSSFSQKTSKNPGIDLNNLASTLIQRLSAVALMHNYDQSLKKTTALPINSEILNSFKNSLSSLNNSSLNEKSTETEGDYKDLINKNKLHNSNFSKFNNKIETKSKVLNTSECSDEYASTLSPSDTASTSDSLKSEYSKIFDNKNNEFIKKPNLNEQNINVKKQSTNYGATKKTNNKAISEVIERLNMNLPGSCNTKEINSNSSAFDKNEKNNDKLKIIINNEKLDSLIKNESSVEKKNLTESQKCSSAPVSPRFNYSSDNEESCYKCKFCNIIFNEYPLYSIHIGMHSNLNPWQCSACNHVCSDKIDFAFHILHLSKKQQ